MLNWSEYEKEEKADRRRTILPLAAWAIAIGLILGAVFYAAKLHAAPLFQVQEKDIAITLYDEPCTLKEHVANLPYRAVWAEKGHSFEGCFGAWPDAEAGGRVLRRQDRCPDPVHGHQESGGDMTVGRA